MSKQRSEEVNRVEVGVGLKVVTGIGGKVAYNGGEEQVLRCEIPGSTDRGEQQNTLLIKEVGQSLKNG